MHAVIQRVITNHNMWPIFSTNVSLRVQSYFRSFLLHGRLKAMRAMNIWTRSIGGYIQECTVLCVKALGLVIEIWISIRNFHWRKKTIWKCRLQNVCHLFSKGQWVNQVYSVVMQLRNLNAGFMDTMGSEGTRSFGRWGTRYGFYS